MTGCQQQPRQQPTPELDLDPTHEVTLVGWWYNGTEVLRLEDNSQYQLFADTNRYARPLSNGQWSQKTYATLYLSPYNTPTSMRQRLTVTRSEDRVQLHLPNYDDFFRWNPQDVAGIKELSTTWESSFGTLELRSDRRYEYRPTSNSNPAMSVGHQGIWSLENQVVTLFPDPQGVQQMSFQLRNQPDADEAIELWSPSFIYYPASD